MLRRVNILKIAIQCLLRDINHTKLNSRICSYYNTNEVLKNHILVKD